MKETPDDLREKIRQLRLEAIEVGYDDVAATCEAALKDGGDAFALDACTTMIRRGAPWWVDGQLVPRKR